MHLKPNNLIHTRTTIILLIDIIKSIVGDKKIASILFINRIQNRKNIHGYTLKETLESGKRDSIHGFLARALNILYKKYVRKELSAVYCA